MQPRVTRALGGYLEREEGWFRGRLTAVRRLGRSGWLVGDAGLLCSCDNVLHSVGRNLPSGKPGGRIA